MAINDLVHDTTFKRIPSFTLKDDTYSDDEQEQSEIHDHIIGALKECLEEIDIEAKELFKKFVSNRYVELSLGKLAQEAMGDSRASDFLGKMVTKIGKKMKAEKDEEFVVTERGASIDDELSQKLERFKVKTVNIGGVVKEDNK
ncbi:hypothetical protein L1987_84377 [Smallanthus sonchifolius]|uniref:Uncharacterized protein n=1 Tax=Smallanthus sonchifolius TaxID=185202 RepID=A0ACB8YEG2_9ASTR|nr:hypothetical protein L1987_84377 [Smallanthus sonchifolius]